MRIQHVVWNLNPFHHNIGCNLNGYHTDPYPINFPYHPSDNYFTDCFYMKIDRIIRKTAIQHTYNLLLAYDLKYFD